MQKNIRKNTARTAKPADDSQRRTSSGFGQGSSMKRVLDIDSIDLCPLNPYSITRESIDEKKDSFLSVGQLDPIIVVEVDDQARKHYDLDQKASYMVLSGHTRLKAAREMKLENLTIKDLNFGQIRASAASGIDPMDEAAVRSFIFESNKARHKSEKDFYQEILLLRRVFEEKKKTQIMGMNWRAYAADQMKSLKPTKIAMLWGKYAPLDPDNEFAQSSENSVPEAPARPENAVKKTMSSLRKTHARLPKEISALMERPITDEEKNALQGTAASLQEDLEKMSQLIADIQKRLKREGV